jgi:hypothetical protein
MWPVRVGAGHIQPSAGFRAAFQRVARMFLTLGVKGSTRRAPFQFARCRDSMMARYPPVRPRFPNEILGRAISGVEHQILEHREGRHALDGLNNRQRKEQAALFLATIESLKSYRAHRRRADRVHKLAGEAPNRTRMLARRLEKARRALADLRE